MAKTVTCEVLSTIKGLNPKAPKEYIHAGTPDSPTLIELPGNSATEALIASGAIRIWPGPPVSPALPESKKIEDLKARIAELEEQLGKATEAAQTLKVALKSIQVAEDLEAAAKIAEEALQ